MNQDQAQHIFRKACDTLVEIIEKRGINKEEKNDQEKITHALSRALALYVNDEEFEKCSLIQREVKKTFGVNLEPDFESLVKIGLR